MQALLAYEGGEYPVGAVVVRDGQIVGRGHNAQTERRDPTAHAEVVAIRAACEALGERKLTGCVLYTTLEPCPMCEGAIEPCPMCEGAIVEADIERLVFGGPIPAYVRDVKFGAASFVREGPIDARGRELFDKRLREKGRHEVLGDVGTRGS